MLCAFVIDALGGSVDYAHTDGNEPGGEALQQMASVTHPDHPASHRPSTASISWITMNQRSNQKGIPKITKLPK
jgi:hypothetical protein